MRSTEVGVLFSRSETRRQLLCCGIYRLPSPLWLLVVLMLLIRASTSGVGEQIGIRPLDCCGMRINTSKCWTDLACVCEDCRNRTEDLSGLHGSYPRLEFCSSFPIIKALNGAFPRNRTFCQEKINKLREVDNSAYQRYQSFEGIIERTYCEDRRGEGANTYSATSTCRDCLEAYKNWICFTKLLNATQSKERTCVDLCETVLQKCPYLQPVPNVAGNLVQVGYSAFNCPESTESNQEEDCFHVDPMVECKQNNYTSTIQPTLITTTVASTSNSTSNSTSAGGR